MAHILKRNCRVTVTDI